MLFWMGFTSLWRSIAYAIWCIYIYIYIWYVYIYLLRPPTMIHQHHITHHSCEEISALSGHHSPKLFMRMKFYYRKQVLLWEGNSIIKRSIMRRKFQCRKHISIRRRKLYGKAVLLWKRNCFLTRKLQYGKGVSFLWRKFYYGLFYYEKKVLQEKSSIMRRKFYYGTSFIMRRKFNNGKTFPLRKGRSLMEK